jgi:hypothetical protein
MSNWACLPQYHDCQVDSHETSCSVQALRAELQAVYSRYPIPQYLFIHSVAHYDHSGLQLNQQFDRTHIHNFWLSGSQIVTPVCFSSGFVYPMTFIFSSYFTTPLRRWKFPYHRIYINHAAGTSWSNILQSNSIMMATEGCHYEMLWRENIRSCRGETTPCS